MPAMPCRFLARLPPWNDATPTPHVTATPHLLRFARLFCFAVRLRTKDGERNSSAGRLFPPEATQPPIDTC